MNDLPDLGTAPKLSLEEYLRYLRPSLYWQHGLMTFDLLRPEVKAQIGDVTGTLRPNGAVLSTPLYGGLLSLEKKPESVFLKYNRSF